jgi:molybdate transport system substrate-binding protein
MKKLISLLTLTSLSFGVTLEFYCGATMAKAMRVIADKFEQKTGVNIHITPGGSDSLYKKLLKLKKADLYLPGADKYITEDKNDIFIFQRLIGYNRAVILVQKNNPKNIKSLADFEKPDIRVVLGDKTSGSVGKISKKILIRYKDENFYKKIYQKAIKAPTSVEIIQALKNNQADTSINWKAAAFDGDNEKYVDFIKIPYIAPKQKLILAVTKYSMHPDLARQFVKFVTNSKNKRFLKSKGF